jgi:lytic murein transglycosylase
MPLWATPAPAVQPTQSELSAFATYKAHLRELAQKSGIREGTIETYLPALRLNEQAIALDRAQMPSSSPSGGSTESITSYLSNHVTPNLILEGQRRYHNDWPHLVPIYQRYGVDPAILMAIYGEETHYGAITGSFDLLDALSSLAYEGRRRNLFETEFLAALKLIDEGVPRERLVGSYAGAMGYPQFMPTLALRLRADGDGDGYADIWSNELDALASIANAFHEAGWKPGVPWGTRVQVHVAIDRHAIQSNAQEKRCPSVFRRLSRPMTVAHWRARGVTLVGRPLKEGEMTSLIEPDGPDGTGYLVTQNYRAILAYDCSNYYGISVGVLSDAIARR